jgi:hypothetical protein
MNSDYQKLTTTLRHQTGHRKFWREPLSADEEIFAVVTYMLPFGDFGFAGNAVSY